MTSTVPGGSAARTRESARLRTVVCICVATLLAMSVWFSASFIVVDLVERWRVASGLSGLITFAVQVGFIAGAIGSATLGVAERFGARVTFSVASLAAAACNGLLLVADSYEFAVLLRFGTGIALAGIYPVAVRAVLSWVQPTRQGLATGVLIGALTVGSATPHLVVAAVPTSWQIVVVVTTIAVAVGGIVFVVGVPPRGPGEIADASGAARPRVSVGAVFRAMRVRAVRLVTLAYLGHMWELYAMWAWVGLFLSTRTPGLDASTASLAGFVVIGVGALGALAAGALGDRFGKARVAELSLWASGACAALLSLSSGWPQPLVIGLCAVWGFWVIADSGLLSALLGDVAPRELLGSVIALQLAVGYAVSAVTILVVPIIRELASWETALPLLAVGPAVAVVCLRLLRRGLRSA